MKHKWSDVQLAFEFVSSGPMYANQAVVSRETGEIWYGSDFGDSDPGFPEDIDDSDAYVSVPHKNDLELGRDLVFRFAEEFMPEEYETILEIFRKKGAYARLKAFLDRMGRLDEWYRYEQAESDRALREWCEENGLEVE
jgi:hypothetical protein